MMIRQKKAALLALAVLCMAVTGCSLFFSKSQESLTNWAREHRETWEEILSLPRPGAAVRRDGELTGPWSRFRDGRLREVYCDPETGDFSLFFNGYAKPPEGDQCLVWSNRPAEEIVPPLPDEAEVLQRTDTRLHLTGFGAGGKGYVIAERLFENWYYLEYNFPT